MRREVRAELLALRKEVLELREHGVVAGDGHAGELPSRPPPHLPEAVKGMAVALRQVKEIADRFEEEVIELGAHAEAAREELEERATEDGGAAVGAGGTKEEEEALTGAVGRLTDRALVFCAAVAAVAGEASRPDALRLAYEQAEAETALEAVAEAASEAEAEAALEAEAESASEAEAESASEAGTEFGSEARAAVPEGGERATSRRESENCSRR